jgi:hypothetical protein
MAEVQHLDCSVFTNLDVRWLQIAMNNPALMRELHGFGDLARNRQCIFQRNRTLCEAFGERGTFHQFEDQRAILHAVDRGDVGVIQGGEDLGFTREARQPIRVADQRIRKNFDGYVASQLGVGGAVDGTHAALSEFSSDLVVGEVGRWGHRSESGNPTIIYSAENGTWGLQ